MQMFEPRGDSLEELELTIREHVYMTFGSDEFEYEHIRALRDYDGMREFGETPTKTVVELTLKHLDLNVAHPDRQHINHYQLNLLNFLVGLPSMRQSRRSQPLRPASHLVD
jgi:hypothetical protein